MRILHSGDRFNKFTVIDSTPVTINKRNKFKVRCDCGNEVLRRKDYLISGRSKSCKSCSCKETYKKHGINHKQLKNIGDLGRTFYSSIRSGAKRRGY